MIHSKTIDNRIQLDFSNVLYSFWHYFNLKFLKNQKTINNKSSKADIEIQTQLGNVIYYTLFN